MNKSFKWLVWGFLTVLCCHINPISQFSVFNFPFLLFFAYFFPFSISDSYHLTFWNNKCRYYLDCKFKIIWFFWVHLNWAGSVRDNEIDNWQKTRGQNLSILFLKIMLKIWKLFIFFSLHPIYISFHRFLRHLHSWARLSQHRFTSPSGGTPIGWHCSLNGLFIQVIDVVVTLSLSCFGESWNPLDYLTRKHILKIRYLG